LEKKCLSQINNKTLESCGGNSFAIQKQMDNLVQESMSSFMHPSMFGNSVLDVEDDVFHNVKDILTILSTIYSIRQMFTQYMQSEWPIYDIIENSNKFKVRAEIPGVDAKNWM